MKLSFSTLGCPDWPWKQILRNGPRFGFDGVEIRLIERETDLLARPEFAVGEWARRRRELADSGFAICGLASSVRFDEPDAPQRAARLETGRRYLDLAAGLGAGFVRVFGDVFPKGAGERERADCIQRIAENLDRLGEHAEDVGVDVVVETHGDFAASDRMRQLMSAVTSPRVGVLWDTHHPWRFFGERLADTFATLQGWVRHTHWKDSVLLPDRDGSPEAAAAESQARALMSGHKPADYVLLGGGEFPVLEALQLLHASQYDGWHSLEWEKMWHPEIEPPEVAFPLFTRKMRWFESLLNSRT